MGRIGRRIGDRYRLVERLGAGGMSEVWRGRDEILGRDVAVKVLAPQLAEDDAFRDRMRQEALAAARLCHPHITAIFDFGESLLSEQLTVPYVVMELNDGESVGARLAREGPLPWGEAVTVAAEVAAALATAHARGVVHRDVTPANVMLTRTGAKVVDFGISALVGQRDAAPDGSLLGTPAYLAPERLGGGQVSPATDVYALGLLLYRCLTARLPWPAGNTTEALRAHLYADPEPLPSLPGLPPEVAGLCLRCLAKNPADRPPAVEVATRLAGTIGMQSVIHTSPAPVAVVPEAVAGEPVQPMPPAPWPGRNLRLRAGLRLGKALRLGTAKPLGGGLFVGGQLAREAVGYLAGRHRIQAAATVALLGVVGLGWASAREPAEVGPAQAAAVGARPPIGLRHTAACKVRYRVEKDTGSTFEARLTVVNAGKGTLDDWRMEFAFPGSQRLTEPARPVAQKGRKVVVQAGADLGPGRSVTVTLRGAYRGTNPLPLAFRLDGHSCRAEVLGATTPTTDDAAPAEPVVPAEPAAPAEPAVAEERSSGSAGGARPERRPDRPGPRKTRSRPKSDDRTPPPTREPAVPSGAGGFSVAV